MDCSHGSEQGRKAEGASEQIREHLRKGGRRSYDADLSSYLIRFPRID